MPIRRRSGPLSESFVPSQIIPPGEDPDDDEETDDDETDDRTAAMSADERLVRFSEDDDFGTLEGKSNGKVDR